MLWNRNFSLLIAANILLYIAVYMLFPLIHRWMIQAWSCSELQAAGVTAVFGIALFLPGAFNNYLVDTFSRKNVCTRSIMLLALVGILYPYVSSVEMVVLLRILQGALFGIVLMATGSTLAIDVTPSNNRNAANRVFTWSSIVGMLSGIIIGIEGGNYLSFDTLLYFSAFLCDDGTYGFRYAFHYDFQCFFLSLHRKRFFDIPACQASFYQTDEWKDTDFYRTTFYRSWFNAAL